MRKKGLIIFLIIINLFFIMYIYFFEERYIIKFETTDKNQSAIEYNNWNSIVLDLKKSVVSIECSKKTLSDNETIEIKSIGTGVAIYSIGDKIYIVTNYHVIKGMDDIYIYDNNEQQVKVKKIIENKKDDIAILEISKKQNMNLKIGLLGNSDEVLLGENVGVLGNLLGNGLALSVGVISGWSDANFEKGYFIQTDAAIYEGCSGGALFNSAGEVIGIVKGKISDADNVSMGIVIPINDIISFVIQSLD